MDQECGVVQLLQTVDIGDVLPGTGIDTVEGELDIVKGQGRTVVELDVVADGELPGQGIQQLPGGGDAGDQVAGGLVLFHQSGVLQLHHADEGGAAAVVGIEGGGVAGDTDDDLIRVLHIAGLAGGAGGAAGAGRRLVGAAAGGQEHDRGQQRCKHSLLHFIRTSFLFV